MFSPLKSTAEQKKKRKKSRVTIWDIQWTFADKGEVYAVTQEGDKKGRTLGSAASYTDA